MPTNAHLPVAMPIHLGGSIETPQWAAGMGRYITTESWRPIGDYEGFYEISSHGRVLSLERVVHVPHPRGWRTRIVRECIRPPTPSTANGAARVGLCRDGRVVERQVAHLVLEAFVGARPDGFYARFLNGDRNDCRLGNLRWSIWASWLESGAA